MAVASGALSVMPMNFAGVPLMFRRPRSGFAVWLVALASVQRSEKTRYLIVEIAAEAVGSIHSHSHQVAVPKNRQRQRSGWTRFQQLGMPFREITQGEPGTKWPLELPKGISGRVSKALNALPAYVAVTTNLPRQGWAPGCFWDQRGGVLRLTRRLRLRRKGAHADRSAERCP